MNIETFCTLVPRLALAVTWPVPAPVAQGHHGPLNTATCPIRGLRDPEMMTMEYGGRGGRTRTGTRDVKAADRTAGSSGAGARGATTKILFR